MSEWIEIDCATVKASVINVSLYMSEWIEITSS